MSLEEPKTTLLLSTLDTSFRNKRGGGLDERVVVGRSEDYRGKERKRAEWYWEGRAGRMV